ncbi:hypothetical protein NO932_17955 [Pelagibacterium sp. 26DY04]|uniref:hypothetical protein n=1 Tax=Pelagibacterium sp. 26DY04 TaxID=2967130 RepID=UPI002815566C|nr:hypothetical protein [Pelagibacterium sp. 26DY04]WMT86760.1 hypothetical protein NO932_17955 [Pelagibacterium sp. 26DY04]
MSSVVNGMMLTVVALLLGAGGVYLAARELAPFRFSFAPSAQILARLAEDAPPVPPSVFGANVSLRICEEAMGALGFRLFPSGRIAAIASHCREAAREATGAMPSLSYGHLVEAMALFALGRSDEAGAALGRSQRVGANEQWIAERRVALAEDHYEILGAYGQTGHLNDLALLARSERGIGSVAARYVSNPGFRERATAVVETLPEDIQERFVSLVRSQAPEARR